MDGFIIVDPINHLFGVIMIFRLFLYWEHESLSKVFHVKQILTRKKNFENGPSC